MRRVIIESPYAGDIALNLKYARACMADSLKRGEAPFASHLLYTQEGILDDAKLEERALGIAAGNIWREVADLTTVYRDMGITPGMRVGIDDATICSIPVVHRFLEGEWSGMLLRLHKWVKTNETYEYWKDISDHTPIASPIYRCSQCHLRRDAFNYSWKIAAHGNAPARARFNLTSISEETEKASPSDVWTCDAALRYIAAWPETLRGAIE